MAGHGVDEGDNVPERVVGPALLDLDRGIDGALGVQLFRLFAAAVVARFGPDVLLESVRTTWAPSSSRSG